MRWMPRVGLSLLLAASSLNCARDRAPGGWLDELGRLGLVRSTAPRLSVPVRYGDCPTTASGLSIPRATCTGAGAVPPAGLAALSGRATAALEDGADADALHVVALIDLAWADPEGNLVDRSISYLQTAARLAPGNASVLADLAAAHLVRAQGRQNSRDLLASLEAAAGAVWLDSHHPAALFNRALALEALGLDEQAGESWMAYLAVDSTTEWAAEARARLADVRVPSALSVPTADEALLPEEAFATGMWTLLGAWGAAVLRGDGPEAAGLLRRAAALGDRLETSGGDASLAEATRAVDAAARDTAATRRLAAAHAAAGEAMAAYLDVRYGDAQQGFETVAGIGAPSAALARWAELFHAATLVYGVRAEGRAMLERIAPRADTLRHPAFAGRAAWMLGTTLFRAGAYERALASFRRAEALFARIGEDEHRGAVQYLAAEAEFALGAHSAAYASMHASLATLRPYRASVWLHNLLYVAGQAAVADGYPRAGLHLQHEGVAVATRNGHPLYVTEAHLARARLLASIGEGESAGMDLTSGEAAIPHIGNPFGRRWMEADLRLAEAGNSVRDDPRRAAAALDSVVSFFAHFPLRLVPALIQRADARLATGDEAGAEADLEQATMLLASIGTDVRSVAMRASLLESARGSFDRLVMLQLADGRQRQALGSLARGRALASRGAPPALPGGTLRAAPGTVAAEYALVGDTLLAWTLTDAELNLTRTIVRRDSLDEIIERTRAALELRAHGPAVDADLEALYEILIGPIEARLAGGAPLTVVADGELAALPFAALRDRRRGRYLVEDRAVRFAQRIDGAVGADRRTTPAPRSALLVSDPAFDAAAYPALARLPGAAAEVQALAAEYPDADVLAGSAATQPAFAAAFGRAAVVHFAGHAVFDDEQPERSALLLAPDGTGRGDGLTAAEVERLDLRDVRLVVLSACQTLRSRAGRSGGFAGLSGALLAAGADGVVGSLWRVDDELTRALMVEFHREFRRSGDGAAALRAAQLRLLRASDPAQRSPAAWSGFRYAGN
jgi:CHAT domain-containing protein/enamine deaminase RidA (YjgF/YER057c/UK114 family)